MNLIQRFFNKEEVKAIQTSIPNNKKTEHFFEFNNKTNYRITTTTKKWRDALAYAEDWERPDRIELLRIYKDLILDSTVSNSIDIRTSRILSIPFSIVNKNDNINKKVQAMFDKYWFEKYIKFAMESIFYGHSLIQIDGFTKKEGITDVTLIPRENVIPEFGLFNGNDYNSNNDGTDYMQPKIYKWLCEAYHTRRDLGLLNNIAVSQITKKTATVAWAQFVEKFGEPMVIGRTNSNIETEKQDLQNFLTNISMNSAAVLDKQTDIEFKETTRADVYSVYKELISTMNDEINTVVLGATEITSGGSGGSEARAKIHEIQSNYKTAADIKYIKNNINNVLIPKLEALKIIPKGLQFKFDFNEVRTMEEQILIDKEISNLKGVLSDEYIEKTYDVELSKDEIIETPITNINEDESTEL